jgi:hypothetical protein
MCGDETTKPLAAKITLRFDFIRRQFDLMLNPGLMGRRHADLYYLRLTKRCQNSMTNLRRLQYTIARFEPKRRTLIS